MLDLNRISLAPYKYLTILQELQAWGKYIISAAERSAAGGAPDSGDGSAASEQRTAPGANTQSEAPEVRAMEYVAAVQESNPDCSGYGH